MANDDEIWISEQDLASNKLYVSMHGEPYALTVHSWEHKTNALGLVCFGTSLDIHLVVSMKKNPDYQEPIKVGDRVETIPGSPRYRVEGIVGKWAWLNDPDSTRSPFTIPLSKLRRV